MNRLLIVATVALISAICSSSWAQIKVTVEAEEEVYEFTNPDNGADPFWCYGDTCIARIGDDVFASGMEVIPDAKPEMNTRWLLFQRASAGGWKLIRKDDQHRTREPSPMGVFPTEGTLLLSVNPSLAPIDQRTGPAQPQILRFSAQSPADPFETILPTWDGQPKFDEHSYRSFAIDSARKEMLLIQNVGYAQTEWSFCDASGKWISQGQLAYPFGPDYAKPQPIRVCYPSVELHNRSVYFLGVSDIVEPNPAWREFKLKLTGREWDYDFRRLFFTWCPDITTGKFEPWVEIASREKTAGNISPCDLHVDPSGLVHIIWTERALDERLRKDFFPNEKQSFALNYAVIQSGKVISQTPILIGGEGLGRQRPGRGRFQITPDGRLFVIFYVSGQDAAGQAISENRLVEIKPDHTIGPETRVPLEHPLSNFFIATPRAGCAPSKIVDLLGDGRGVARYARIRLITPDDPAGN
jgi:hypothetical protein